MTCVCWEGQRADGWTSRGLSSRDTHTRVKPAVPPNGQSETGPQSGPGHEHSSEPSLTSTLPLPLTCVTLGQSPALSEPRQLHFTSENTNCDPCSALGIVRNEMNQSVPCVWIRRGKGLAPHLETLMKTQKPIMRYNCLSCSILSC